MTGLHKRVSYKQHNNKETKASKSVWKGQSNLSGVWLVKRLHNFDRFSKIKQQPDRDWSADPEMKWVMGMNESAETKGKFVVGKLEVQGWVIIGAYDIVWEEGW